MSKKLKKTMKDCISKLKKSTKTLPSTSSTSSSLLDCNRPKTPSSFAVERRGVYSGSGHAATLSDVDRFLLENFRSLYVEEEEKTKTSRSRYVDGAERVSTTLESSSRVVVCGGVGGERKGDGSKMERVEEEGCLVISTYSGDPYEDFKRCMGEMVEWRCGGGERLDWDIMEDVLFTYLSLNERKSYKYILASFVDLVVQFRTPTTTRGRWRRRSN